MARIVWKRRNVIICSCTFCLFAVFATAVAVVAYISMCSNSVSVKQLNEMCELFTSGQITGDLCKALCIDKSLKFHNCLHVGTGKIVFHLSWNDSSSAVMKSKHSDIGNFLTFDFKKIGTHRLFPIPSPSLLREEISNLLRSRLGKDVVINPNDLLDVQRSESDLEYRSKIMSKWLLLQQDEYLLLSYLRHHLSIPRLFGSCGHYYVTEFLPPGKHFHDGNFFLKVFPSGWKRRVDLAVQMIDLMQSFADDFGSPLNFCDMKGSNFGIGLRGKVKPIDLDMAAFEGYLMEIFHPVNCSDDSDCEFFDCRGWCMSKQRRCLPIRINTNMQTLCENIFLGDFKHHVYAGLLSSPPLSIREELTDVLNRCRNPAVDRYRRSIGVRCRSAMIWEIDPLPSAVMIECGKAIEELRNFLADESRVVHRLLKEILSRDVGSYSLHNYA